jgi:hypothetical protein
MYHEYKQGIKYLQLKIRCIKKRLCNSPVISLKLKANIFVMKVT